MGIGWGGGLACRCAGVVRRSTTADTMGREVDYDERMLWRECLTKPEKEFVRRKVKKRRAVPKHAKDSNWRESLHAAPVSTGGERSWISAVVSLSTTIIGPPQLGQSQRSFALLAPDLSGSVGGVAAEPSN